MSKQQSVTQEEARTVIDRVAQELGLVIGDTTGFIKVSGPSNKHRLYVQKSKSLNRIDCTIELPKDDPAYVQLDAPNGSIKCKVTPTLEQLERVLRMLGDSSQPTQTPNKPRPFAPTRQMGRKPKAVAMPLPEEALQELPQDVARLELEERLEKIKARGRELRINRLMEERGISREEATKAHDDKAFARASEESQANAVTHELNETLSEAGIEVES